MNTTTEAPGIEEQYVSACHTSNLRVEADRRGAGDMIIAAGMNPVRLGGALLRLHTRCDTLGLEKVQIAVSIQANYMGIKSPDSISSAVVGWWLSKVCKKCHGRKFDVIPNTPSLSTKHCKACYGTGEERIPFGDDGRALASWLDDCKAAAVHSIKRRLRPTT